MTRPKYENDGHMTIERQTVGYVADVWRVGFYKMPESYRCDYAFTRNGRVVAFCEIKARSNPRDKYASYSIALGKWMALANLTEFTALAVLLIVRWTDVIGVLKVEPLKDTWIEWGGRADRGDPDDREPMIHIPIEAFKRMAIP